MARPRAAWTDERVEGMIGTLLRIGVFVAAGFVLLGAGIFLLRHGFEKPDYQVFHSEPADLRSIKGILLNSFLLQGRGLIQLGLLFLILTPIARVAFSVVAFIRQKDMLYVFVTLAVLTLLLFSLAGGRF